MNLTHQCRTLPFALWRRQRIAAIAVIRIHCVHCGANQRYAKVARITTSRSVRACFCIELDGESKDILFVASNYMMLNGDNLE